MFRHLPAEDASCRRQQRASSAPMASFLAKETHHRVPMSTRFAVRSARVGVGADAAAWSGAALPPFLRGGIDGSTCVCTSG